MVGAVLLRDGRIVAEGWHARHGGPHAEIAALSDARDKGIDPAGLTMVVTLEPCCHHGKTPPCTDALIQARLAKLVVAMPDPFDEVSGRGIKQLREAGIEVEVGIREDQARRLNEAFIKKVTAGLPWVIVKWAQTLDGKIAARTGDSQWISSDASRRRVHELRGRVDAVMVGIGTVLADDPQLTARDVEMRRVARRVVLDPQLRMTGDERLFQTPEPVTIAYEAREETRIRDRFPHAEPFALEKWCGRRLDLEPLLRHLAREHQATNILVEGGAGLTGSLLEQGLVDQVLAFIAPRLMGDVEALDPVSGSPCASIAESVQLELRSHERIADDLLLDYRVKSPST